MEYMLLLSHNEADVPERGTEAFDAWMADWFAYNQKLIDGGHWITGGALQPSSTATTVRLNGAGAASAIVVDGPNAETKEQIGGFYLIKAADLDVALELARAVPIGSGSIEVRPVASRPDAG